MSSHIASMAEGAKEYIMVEGLPKDMADAELRDQLEALGPLKILLVPRNAAGNTAA